MDSERQAADWLLQEWVVVVIVAGWGVNASGYGASTGGNEMLWDEREMMVLDTLNELIFFLVQF